jgi:hypothetical protein
MQKKTGLIIILALTVIVIIVSLLMGILNFKVQPNNNQSKVLTLDDFYSEDICRCLVHELNKCTSGYELNGNLCVNNTLGTFTNVIKGCSEYECAGVGYKYNPDTKNWEDK